MSAALDALLASASPEFVVLVEPQLAEAVGPFTLSAGGAPTLSNSTGAVTGFSGAGPTTGSGDSRIIVVRIATDATSISAVTITMSGSPLAATRLSTLSSGGRLAEIWYYLAPAASTASTIAITNTGGAECIYEAGAWSGVDQTSPFGTVLATSFNTASPSHSYSGTVLACDVVLDVLASNAGSATEGAGQTVDGNAADVSVRGSFSHESVVSESATMSWSLSGSAANPFICAPLQGFPEVYGAPWSSDVQTSISGGLYRRLDQVRQNGTALTSRASKRAVLDTNGSYYHDTANNIIYVSATNGANPNTFALIGAWFTLPLSTGHISFSDQPVYYPLVSGDLPVLVQEKPDILFGATMSDTGSVTFENGDGQFDALIANWIWRNKLVTFKLGGVGLAYSDFETVAKLRINSVQVDDEVCRVELVQAASILNRTIPPRLWSDGTYATDYLSLNFAGSDSLSKPQPWLFGTVRDCPLALLDSVTYANGLYGTVDPTAHPYGVTVSAVYAIDKSTGIGVTLTENTDWDWVTGGQLLQILNASYGPDTHIIWADLSDDPDPEFPLGPATPDTFGTLIELLLGMLGVDAADIDSAAFDAADAAATQLLGLWVDEPVPAADIVRIFEQSVNGQVFVGDDGRWTCRIFDPSGPADYTLSDHDFEKWKVSPDLLGVLNEVRVNYLELPGPAQTTQVSSSDSKVLYGSETSDSHTVFTALRVAADATALANHTRFLKGRPGAFIEFEERGLTLMGATAGSLVAVTRARGPVGRTGSLDGQLLELTRLELSLGPVPRVRGVLSDLGGQADRIFRLADSAITWSTTTDENKAYYGFLADANGYIDAADSSTRHGKVLW